MKALPAVDEKDVALVEIITSKLVGVGLNVALVRDLGPEVSDATKEVAVAVFGSLVGATNGYMGSKRFQGLTEQVYIETFNTVRSEAREYWDANMDHLTSKDGKEWTWGDTTGDDGNAIKGFRSSCLDSVSNLRMKLVWISYAHGAKTIQIPDGEDINFKRDAWNFISTDDASLHGTYKQCQDMLETHCLPTLSQRFTLINLDDDGDPIVDKNGKKETTEYSFTAHEDMDSYQTQRAVVDQLLGDEEATHSEVVEAVELLDRMKVAMVKSFKDQDEFKGLIIDGRSIAKARKVEAEARAEAEAEVATAEHTEARDVVVELLEAGATASEIREAVEVVREAQAEKVSA